MLDRLHWCEARIELLAEGIEGYDAALGNVLVDLREGRVSSRDDWVAMAAIAELRAEDAEELLRLVRESGSLRLGLVASRNAFRLGGIASRSRMVRLVRAQAEGNTASAAAWASELRGEAQLIEMTHICGEWHDSATASPAEQLTQARSRSDA